MIARELESKESEVLAAKKIIIKNGMQPTNEEQQLTNLVPLALSHPTCLLPISPD